MAKRKVARLQTNEIKKFDAATTLANLINVVEGFDTESLNIKDEVDDLKSIQPELLTFKNGTEETLEVWEFKKVRKEMHYVFRSIQLLKDRLELRNKLLTPKEKKSIVVFLDKQTKGLLQTTDTNFLNKTTAFITELDANESMKALLIKAGFTEYLTNIRELLPELKELSDQKGIKQGSRELAQTLNIKKKMVNLVHNLFIKIELMSDKDKSTDYTPLINSINNLIIKIKSQKKAAITRAQNQQLASLQSGENETTVESSAKTPSTVV